MIDRYFELLKESKVRGFKFDMQNYLDKSFEGQMTPTPQTATRGGMGNELKPKRKTHDNQHGR